MSAVSVLPRVAFFLGTLNPGGAERVMLNLMQALLAKREHAVDLLLLKREGALLREVPEHARVIELSLSDRMKTLRALARLPRNMRPSSLSILTAAKLPNAVRAVPSLATYMTAERPAGMLTTLSNNNIAALWAANISHAPVRVVVREATTLSVHVEHTAPCLRTRLSSLLRGVYPQAAGIVAVSQGVGEDLATLTGLTADRITTIYNPVDVARLRKMSLAQPDHPWLRPGEPPVILAVGRLRVDKDFPTLLRAFALLRARRPARLMILGEGTERDVLESLAKDLGIDADLSLPGFTDNPYRYMARAAVLALSSVTEGCPNVLLEAMACGCPVVSTDCPSGPKELLENGRWGPLVPMGNAERLAEVIAERLDSARDSEGLQARASQFAPDRVLNSYMQLVLGSDYGLHN